MKPEMLDQVLAGIDALIADELTTKDPGRYARIGKLCGHAHQLSQMGVTRVGDVRDQALAVVNHGPDYIGAVGYDALGADDAGLGNGLGGLVLPVPQHRFNGGDATDMIREVVGALERFRQQVNPSTKQLDRLLDIRDRLGELGRDTTVIDAKIDNELAALAAEDEEDSDADPDADPDLAGAVVLRGHPTSGHRPPVLHPDRGPTDGAREGGAPGPGDDRRQESLDDVSENAGRG